MLANRTISVFSLVLLVPLHLKTLFQFRLPFVSIGSISLCMHSLICMHIRFTMEVIVHICSRIYNKHKKYTLYHSSTLFSH